MVPVSLSLASARARWSILLVALLNWIGTLLWVWIGVAPEGLGNRSAKLFYWHPTLASCAMLVLFPPAFLAWRGEQSTSHARTKWFHAILMIAAFVVLNVAISLAFFSHKQQKLPNFYSIHSWVGMLAVGSMKGNLLGGLLSTFSSYVRGMKLASKIHRLSGILACVLGFVAMLLGFAKEHESVVKKSGKPLGVMAIVGGGLGLISLFVGVLVTSAVLFDQKNKKDQVITKTVDEELSETIERDVSEYET